MAEQRRIAEPVAIPPLGLEGNLAVPPGARGLVAFAHGSGSSRLSPRNTYVAERLQDRGLATLLFDLLLEDEARDRAKVFDIALLAERLETARQWLREDARTRDLAIGYFGASTGAAAALIAAAGDPQIAAVVSRGGRPDLAGDALRKVRAPTLLIVGGADTQVLALNQEALAELAGPKRLSVVEGATHLFEEPGSLDRVVDLAGEWFGQQFTRAADARRAATG